MFFGLIFLGMLSSFAIGSLIYDHFDDDDDKSSSNSDPDDPPIDEGLTLTYDGSDDLIGSNDDDILPLGQEAELAPANISLKGGDDVAFVEHPFGIEVDGGAGDDTLGSFAVGNSLIGGKGNDILYGIDANSMSGGEGDDTITFDSDVEYNSDVAQIDGGDGDDTINIYADAGLDLPDRGGAIVTGGEGADTFNVVLDLYDSQVDLDGGGTPLESNICRINDFDPDEDVLQIFVETEPENVDRPLTFDFEQTEDSGVYTTTIDLTFGETDTAFEAVASMTLVSDTAFTSDDIILTVI